MEDSKICMSIRHIYISSNVPLPNCIPWKTLSVFLLFVMYGLRIENPLHLIFMHSLWILLSNQLTGIDGPIWLKCWLCHWLYLANWPSHHTIQTILEAVSDPEIERSVKNSPLSPPMAQPSMTFCRIVWHGIHMWTLIHRPDVLCDTTRVSFKGERLDPTFRKCWWELCRWLSNLCWLYFSSIFCSSPKKEEKKWPRRLWEPSK